MALLVMILRKMIKNKWLELSLLLGLILSVALVSSMPIYTGAILQRMLVKDLESQQVRTQQYPGVHWTSVYMDGQTTVENRPKYIKNIDSFMENQAKPGFSLPATEYVRERATDMYNWVPVHPDKVNATVRRIAEIGAMSGLEDNIKLVDGRLPAKETVDGVYEVLVVEQALSNLKMVLGNEFIIKDDTAESVIKIKPVGVIERKDYESLYWFTSNLANYSDTFFINFDLFEKDFTSSKVIPLQVSYWYFALDYSNMNLDNVQSYIKTHNMIESYLFKRYNTYSVKANALKTIDTYFDREKKLRTMLWSLNVPVMIMLAFYLFMVSNLITERQKTEIAVLRSRGASRWQIMVSFIIEGVLLGAIAFAIGPHIGLMFTKILGASNGFLEFVQRSALQAKVDGEAYQYGLIAVGFSLVMTLIPAFLATRTTIVGHKQQMARAQRKSFWHKYFIDIMLIGVSIYGLRGFHRRMEDMLTLGLDSSDFKVDPLLFLIPALFILGTGLVCLRVYPWFIRLVYWLGRKFWPPSLYSTLIQVGRSSTQYQFLMVFLIMTIATGLYSASAARTINKNAEDKIRYQNGSDIVLNIRWKDDAPPAMPSGMPGGGGAASVEGPKKKIQYTEYPFQPIEQLPGIEHIAKVFIKQEASFSSGQQKGTTQLMGIETDEFGRTAWLRDGLLGNHFNEYLNLIALDPSAVLISKTMAEQKSLQPGDQIEIGWDGVAPKTFIVYGILDFFPSFNPNPMVGKSGAKAIAPMLVVGHLDYIQNNLALEPYEVWIKLKPDVSRQELYDAISEKSIPLVDYKDTKEQLIEMKNDPFQLAMNGVMTLGFLISIIISFFGFLLYWILSLFGRILQLGILRAMGISFMQLIGMLIAEQALTSGAAILIGVLTGNVTSHIFVPLFQLTYNPSTQVPPFKVTFDPRDSLQLYVIVTFMITTGLFILGYLLSRIKIHQAVKLGED